MGVLLALNAETIEIGKSQFDRRKIVVEIAAAKEKSSIRLTFEN